MKRHNKYKHGNESINRLLLRQQDMIDELNEQNTMLRQEKEQWKSHKDSMVFVIKTLVKESNQNVMSFKYISSILIMMDYLQNILEDNDQMGKIVKAAILAFKEKLGEGIHTINYDGNTVWYDNEVIDFDDDEETD